MSLSVEVVEQSLPSEQVADVPIVAIAPSHKDLNIPLGEGSEDTFSSRYTREQTQAWENYTKELLAKTNAVDIAQETVGDIRRGRSRLTLAKAFTSRRVDQRVAFERGEETYTFGIMGLYIPLRGGDLIIGTKSRGSDEEEDLRIGREFGVFFRKRDGSVYYAASNRQLPSMPDANTHHISPLMIETLRENLHTELARIPELARQPIQRRRPISVRVPALS